MVIVVFVVVDPGGGVVVDVGGRGGGEVVGFAVTPRWSDFSFRSVSDGFPLSL